MQQTILNILNKIKGNKEKILVVGLGITGIESALTLKRNGINVIICERSEREQYLQKSKFADRLPEIENNKIEVAFGIDGAAVSSIAKDVSLAVISPGVPFDSPLANTLRQSNIKIMSEFELGIELLKAPTICITGSNGKGTTTTLIGEILKADNQKVKIAGNIGTPVISEVGSFWESHPYNGWLVAEASSYQLEACSILKPQIALLLNISENHLERHKTIERYLDCKLNIFRQQTENDLAILSYDDKMVFAHAKNLKSKVALFGSQIDAPHQDRAEICYHPEKNQDWIDLTFGGRAERFDFTSQGNIGKIHLFGYHNRLNIAAAILAARAAGASTAAIVAACRSFTGLPHRQQLVGEKNGVRFINDSKSTSIAASEAAIKTTIGRFGKDAKIILMLGGISKGGSSWQPLINLIESEKDSFKTICCFGKDGEVILDNLKSLPTKKCLAKNLEEALIAANSSASTGDIVLFSPACASFDEFKDFEHRGERFRQLVEKL
ncbi:MAG TPA: UDP-N-acetylmuramoyl-L-alanine--D-glutamate ligase [Oligoflexia bacterium]|nr:UDP-N-acetylmuramoyl-L-alanine--D-glutamate ligase [Oligoflexia bacterium]HMP27829.1 UDP-N-acetylmuramoyl-L-alanine--D-glutamate ligase [Oligoflexia bacterium]